MNSGRQCVVRFTWTHVRYGTALVVDRSPLCGSYTEIGEEDLGAFLVTQDVRRLEITVYDMCIVEVEQPIEELIGK